MSNGAKNPLKNVSPRRAPGPLVDPLEEAYEAAKDAQSIIRDAQRREQRSLADYAASEDEDTARHDLRPQFVIENHVHQHSQPDAEPDPSVEVGPVKVTGLPKWAVIAVAAVIAIVTALAALALGH